MVANKEISKKAIEIVEEYEKRYGAKVQIANKMSGYDIISIRSNETRKIEVKGTRKKKPNEGFILNSQEEFNNLENGGYIYRVIDVFGKPEIIELTKDDVETIKEPRWRLKIKRGIDASLL